MQDKNIVDIRRFGPATQELRKSLDHIVAEQDEAVEAICAVFQRFEGGMCDQNRAAGTLLFLGQTGVGKTHLAESLAMALHGRNGAMIKVDCAEFQHGHEISKLVGPPPGYVGFREVEPILSEKRILEVQDNAIPLSVVLFDEIEKANHRLWDLLLGVLDKGKITTGDNKQVDCSSCFLIFTSNLGSREIDLSRAGGMGFSDGEPSHARDSAAALKEARKRFSPEFLNRMDRIVAFNPLDDAALARIFDMEINRAQLRFKRLPFVLVSPEAKRTILASACKDSARYGAREIRRAIASAILDPMARAVANSSVVPSDHVTVECNGGEIWFRRKYSVRNPDVQRLTAAAR